MVPAHPIEASGVTGEWDETQTMGKNFILDNGGVVVDEDVLNGKRGEFCKEDAPKGIRYRGVEVDEGEGGIVG